MKENIADSYTSLDGFNKNMKRFMPTAVFVILLVVSLILITSPKATTAQIASNDNNKPIIIHVHPHLNITIEGKKVTVPAYVGIDPPLWKDHSLDQFGMQSMNMKMIMPAMAPLHTMNNSGIITVESSTYKNYTLDDFIKIWGIDLKHKNVAISVDGKPITDFRNYVLRDKARLNMTIDGNPIQIPAHIGIDPSLWKEHSLDRYGMRSMNMNMVMPGMSPLHTHDTSGTIHVESSVYRNYTLGQFLNNWGLDLNGKTIKATVDGLQVSDYKNIILRDGEQINLDAGK